MATAPNVIVAGHPDLARKLRNTGRFPAVFDVPSATALRELSQSGRVAAPATFMFGPAFEEDLPDAGVAVLANGLAASGFAVLVHSVFSERGDVFDPRVMADTGPLTMAQLLELLSRPDARPAPPRRPPSEPPPPPRRELLHEPPPAAWTTPAPMPAEPVPAPPVAAPPVAAQPVLAQPQAVPVQPQAVPVQPQAVPAEEPPTAPDADSDDPPEYDPPEEDAEYEDEYDEGEDAEPSEDEDEEDFEDVPVAGEQGPAEGPEPEAPHEDEHDHRHVAETRAEPYPFVPAETRAEQYSHDPAEHYSHDPAETVAEPYSPAPAEARAEPQLPAEWMWKETAPEPDHYAGPPPEPDHYAAMPPGPGWQGGQGQFPGPGAPAPAQAAPSGSRRGRIVLMVAAVFVLLAGLMGAAVLAVGPGKDEKHSEAVTSPGPSPTSSAPASSGATSPAPTSPGGASQVPTSTPTAVRPAEQYTPTSVRIADSRVSIEVSWKDASGGKAAYYVVGGPAGQRPSTLASTKQGATKVVVAALNPSVEYCLTVVAVVDVDRVAYARPVCTHRGKREG
ncbi:hypothetical protein GCM10009527_053550 [Actinomadura nitritigenes]|uniref:Fibronectin type-III domain-containing protein n=1 Tax=Actinomadura nitritigenes TaxID=134602 RepID=A0ABS3R9Z6_9ACTN|nr:hypothetical protein [Actinomadura nitritigenes]MBO2443066.1 hypothetical protein [Actinomadura nitritigenes]